MGNLFQPGYLPAQALAGQVFIGATAAAGVTLPAHNGTAQTFGIWNPLGSGVEVVITALDIGIATATTPVVGSFGFSWLANAGSQVAGSAAITAFTKATPVNARLGLGNPSKVYFTPSGATITAPTFLFPIGLSFATTTASNGVQWYHNDFNGDWTIPPGNYVGLGCSAAQSGTVTQVGMRWLELPFNG